MQFCIKIPKLCKMQFPCKNPNAKCNLIPNLCDMMRLRLCVVDLDLYERKGNNGHPLSQKIIALFNGVFYKGHLGFSKVIKVKLKVSILRS